LKCQSRGVARFGDHGRRLTQAAYVWNERRRWAPTLAGALTRKAEHFKELRLLQALAGQPLAEKVTTCSAAGWKACLLSSRLAGGRMGHGAMAARCVSGFNPDRTGVRKPTDGATRAVKDAAGAEYASGNGCRRIQATAELMVGERRRGRRTGRGTLVCCQLLPWLAVRLSRSSSPGGRRTGAILLLARFANMRRLG
jgi:hypothetical protein